MVYFVAAFENDTGHFLKGRGGGYLILVKLNHQQVQGDSNQPCKFLFLKIIFLKKFP